MINNAAVRSRLFAPRARKRNRQLGQLLTSFHVRILAPGLPSSPCTPHRRFAYHPPSRPRLRGLVGAGFSLSPCVCLPFVFYSVSPLSHRRHHNGHRGQPPLRCQSQFRNPTRVKLRTRRARATIQQQRPTPTGKRGRPSKGICGDELTQQNIGLAILARRRKAQPALYIYT